jgi:hypothetical protein
MQQGTRGVAAGRDHVQHARDWRAEHFGSRDNTDAGVTDDVSDDSEGKRSGQRAGQETATGDADVTRHAQSEDGVRPLSDQGREAHGDGGSVAVATASAVVDGRDTTTSAGEAEATPSQDVGPYGAGDGEAGPRREDQR